MKYLEQVRLSLTLCLLTTEILISAHFFLGIYRTRKPNKQEIIAFLSSFFKSKGNNRDIFKNDNKTAKLKYSDFNRFEERD